MTKEKVLEIQKSSSAQNISAAEYCRNIGVKPQIYYQAKSKLFRSNNIYKVEESKKSDVDEPISLIINGFSIQICNDSEKHLIEIFRAIKNV